MRFTQFTLPLLFPLCLASCGPDTAPAAAPKPETAPSQDVAQDLIGTWETIEVDVVYDSYQGGDTTYRQVIHEADWYQLFGVQPARTEFTPDGKHKRTHRLANGQIADITNGLWKMQGGDSLLIIEPNKTLYYAHDLRGDRLVLTGVVDYDLDGATDDEYRSVLRLVSRTQ